MKREMNGMASSKCCCLHITFKMRSAVGSTRILSKIFSYRNSEIYRKNQTIQSIRLTHSFNMHPHSYLKQSDAIALDEELFNYFGVEQLMELAGLSCASAIAEGFPEFRNVLIVVGPGNNGGDGLVCARHLKMFGYCPEIFYPKRTAKTLYENLTKQCELFEVPFLAACPSIEDLNSKYSLVVDALFGFSFKAPVRKEFTEIIDNMLHMSTPCCSIDIPSGWDVENGPLDQDNSLKPVMLISLSAPKLCARFFHGIHYLGGRFIAPALATKYKLKLPNYPSTHNCVRL